MNDRGAQYLYDEMDKHFNAHLYFTRLFLAVISFSNSTSVNDMANQHLLILTFTLNLSCGLCQFYKDSVLYDTWRHFFFVYPSMVILSCAMWCNYLLEKFAAQKIYQYATIAVIAIGIGMLLPLAWIVTQFPQRICLLQRVFGR